MSGKTKKEESEKKRGKNPERGRFRTFTVLNFTFTKHINGRHIISLVELT